MINQWSIDRSRSESSYSDMFDFEIYYQHAYNWVREGGVIVRMVNTNNYIVCEQKYQHLIINFQNFINATNLHFDFDQLKDVVSHVFLVNINVEYWQWSTCTCPFYQKHYSCSHIISVSTSLNLFKLPAHCKNMIQIGEKPKRGRKPNALKGLQTQ